MKKIFTILSIASLSILSFGQDFNTINSQSINGKVSKTSETIYSQELISSQGIVANVLANGNFVATADDFKLSENSKVTKINITGFQNEGTLSTNVAKGVILYIYMKI